MPNLAAPEKAKLSLPSWRMPANRLDWIALGFVGANWVWQRLKERKVRNRDTVLRFSADDAPYYWLLRWLEKMPRQKDLSVFRVMMPMGSDRVEPPSPVGTQDLVKAKVPILVPTEGVSFFFRGVKCHVEKTDAPGPNDRQGNFRRLSEFLSLRIESRDLSFAAQLLEEISEAGASRKEPPKVYVFQWGWQPIRNCPTGRAAILPPGDYDLIGHDMRDFFAAEGWYHDVGLAYRRRYLLHGIPGGGKTTLVIALAGDFDLNVCLLSLANHNDDSLLEAIRVMPSRSILLLEDVDCAFDKERRNKDDKPLTFSGLLNVLDGVGTPEGSVVFMTTNHRERLDAALIRPGRVDKELEFKTATHGQIGELAHRFSRNGISDIPVEQWAGENISMALVQERLIQRFRQPTVKA